MKPRHNRQALVTSGARGEERSEGRGFSTKCLAVLNIAHEDHFAVICYNELIRPARHRLRPITLTAKYLPAQNAPGKRRGIACTNEAFIWSQNGTAWYFSQAGMIQTRVYQAPPSDQSFIRPLYDNPINLHIPLFVLICPIHQIDRFLSGWFESPLPKILIFPLDFKVFLFSFRQSISSWQWAARCETEHRVWLM